MEFMSVLRQVWDMALEGLLGLWQHLTSMPLATSAALGFTILVLLGVTAIFGRGRNGPSGRVYGIEVTLVLIVWLLAWITSTLDGANFFVAAASLLANLGAIFALMMLATVLRPRSSSPR